MSGPIRSVAVVGSGLAAALAAAAFVRHLPSLSVTIVPVADPRPALADLVATTTPAAEAFHRSLGLEDADIIRRTRGGWRLGTRVSADGHDFVHAYGPVGAAIGQVPFAAAYDRVAPSRPFEVWSPGARLGRAGRLPGEAADLAEVGIGLALDPAEYRAYTASFARHHGAVRASAPLAEVRVEGDRVAALRLRDGGTVTTDLYCDATGTERLLAAALPGTWIDWSAWLPYDRLVRACTAPPAAPPTLDAATRIDAGWHAAVALPARTDHLLAYRSAHLEDGAAARLLAERARAGPIDRVAIAAGRAAASWVGNVVAIGDAAATVGILDAAPVQLLHAQLDRIVRTLPDRAFASIEIVHHNRLAAEEADRLRDFQVAHDRRAPRPPELEDTVARFVARGRWRDRDGDLHERTDWQMILYGTGHRPRLLDAAALAADPRDLADALRARAARLDAAVASAPLPQATAR